MQLLSDSRARAMAHAPVGELMTWAAERRDARWGRRLTYSPKVFLPVTNLCRNHCDYCSYRRSPGDEGVHTMSPDEIERQLDAARNLGCSEALFCLGDKPESGFVGYRRQLAEWGHGSTVDYLVWAGERALERGLWPHTNAGILDASEMLRLKRVNVSLGLMLENTSERLCEPGQPHHRAPDKRPARRIEMTREAGRLKIPFTSGILIGIGETVDERIETLLAIRTLHEEYGHVQEVIVQPFRATPDMPMANAPEPADDVLLGTVAMARLILPDDVSVQAPPNLTLDSVPGLIAAGINDFGGISPLTPDFINPRHPWPHIDALRGLCADAGFDLQPRLPIYPDFVQRPGFVDAELRERMAS